MRDCAGLFTGLSLWEVDTCVPPWDAGTCTSEAEVDSSVPLQEADTRTSEAEAGSSVPPEEAGTCTSELEADSNAPPEEVDTCTSEVGADSRLWAVEERGAPQQRSTGQARSTYMRSGASARRSRTCLLNLSVKK
jgi:hypothetical protein